MTVNFNEERHEYTSESGVVLPSVTRIIREVFQLEGWGHNQSAADRGDAVHLICRLVSEGDMRVLERAHPVLQPYGRAWIRATLELQYVSSVWELALASKLGYAGRLDTVGIMGPRQIPALWDAKSGQRPLWVGLQLAGYDMLYRENFPDEPRLARRAIQLSADGTYVLHSGVNIQGVWRDFDNYFWDQLWLSALNVYNSGLLKEG